MTEPLRVYPRELAPGVVLESLGGMCPVQGDGTIDGKPFYFRARGESVSLAIATYGVDCNDAIDVGYGQPGFEIRADIAEWPDAGYVEDDEAEGFILRGALVYRHLRDGGDATMRRLLWCPGAWEPSPKASDEAIRLFASRHTAIMARVRTQMITERLLEIPGVDERLLNDVKGLETELRQFANWATWKREEKT